jgi:Protein of unknown function (DUF1580)
MLDLTTETPIPLAEAYRLVPPGRNGKRTHLSTLLRWILTGAKHPTTGERIRLEALRIGSRWLTSRQALQRFAERLTPSVVDAPPVAPRTSGKRRRAADRAGEELDKIGI